MQDYYTKKRTTMVVPVYDMCVSDVITDERIVNKLPYGLSNAYTASWTAS